MNILVIGNGFDLAHGLPTRCGDFFEWIMKEYDFCNYLEEIGADKKNIRYSIPYDISDQIKQKHSISIGMRKKLWKMINNNVWIEYFAYTEKYRRENWIDFESEISYVIQSLDHDMFLCEDKQYTLEDKLQYISNEFFAWKYGDWFGKISYKTLRNDLVKYLNRLIRAFEIYLTEYVEKLDIQVESPDINELKIDYVLSFNYTHTFSKLYKISEGTNAEKRDPFDYIHGETSKQHNVKTNNMVLGIDEFLSKKRKNRDVEFIAFKKFYQRIYKQTGSKYKDWLNEVIQENMEYVENIRQVQIDFDTNRGFGKEGEQTKYMLKKLKENPPKHNLYIFGHSLDITDRDILRDLILNDNVYTTIYYLNKDVLGQQITNLVKVIGQNELIKRTGGSAKTIIFKQQKDMKLINAI